MLVWGFPDQEMSDSRGICRGSCTLAGCDCFGYTGGSDGMKCLKCLHPPGKHQNLTTSVPAASVQSGVGQFQWNTTSGYHNYSAGVGNTAGYYQPSISTSTLPHSYASAVASPSTGGGYNGYTHQHTSHPAPYRVTTCKAEGCMSPQHYEHGVGLFDYCSPSCRDRHLLPLEKMRLQNDIKKFTATMTTQAVKAPRMERAPDTPSRYQNSATVVTATANQTCSVPELRFSKTPGVKETGIVFSEELYTSDKVKGYLVTGVKCGTLAYNKLESGELRLLDVIVKMNDQDSSIHGKPNVFEERLKREKQVHLMINRDIALPCPKNLLERAKIHKPTHIFALRNASATQSDYGLTIDHTTVRGVRKNTPARECRLKFGDEIVYYAFATKDSIDTPHCCLLDSDISRAARQGQSIILAVKRK